MRFAEMFSICLMTAFHALLISCAILYHPQIGFTLGITMVALGLIAYFVVLFVFCNAIKNSSMSFSNSLKWILAFFFMGGVVPIVYGAIYPVIPEGRKKYIYLGMSSIIVSYFLIVGSVFLNSRSRAEYLFSSPQEVEHVMFDIIGYLRKNERSKWPTSMDQLKNIANIRIPDNMMGKLEYISFIYNGRKEIILRYAGQDGKYDILPEENRIMDYDPTNGTSSKDDLFFFSGKHL